MHCSPYMKNDIKLGLIQSTAVTADFAHNLRAIIQGYRACIDQGAGLVVASAHALSGPDLEDIKLRESFLEQSQLALNYLSQEVGAVPLILAAWSSELSPDDQWALFELEGEREHGLGHAFLTPFLLENGKVTQLEESEAFDLLGLRVAVELSDEEILVEECQLDLLLYLFNTPWQQGQSQKDEDKLHWCASANRCAVLGLRSLGSSTQHIYGGGSYLYNAKAVKIAHLAHFSEQYATFDLAKSKVIAPVTLPAALQLRQALIYSLASTTKQQMKEGICLILASPQSILLAELAIEALGAANVHCLSFQQMTLPESLYGVSYQQISLGELPSQVLQSANLAHNVLLSANQRLRATILMSYAEAHDLLPLTSLNRRQLLTGDFVNAGQASAFYLPFASLYENELQQLGRCDSVPPMAPSDRILQEIHDSNTCPSELIARSPERFPEHEVRRLQRRVQLSEPMRAQLPPILELRPKEQQARYPIYHRFND